MRSREACARARRRVAIAIVCLIACAEAADAQSRIRADVDTQQITVGDHLIMTVSVHHPVGSEVAWPDSLALAPFEVLEARRSPPEAAGDSLRSVAHLTLTAFELGDLEIPSFEVGVVAPEAAEEVLATDSRAVQVVSVGVDEGGEIRDIRGPLAISLSALQLALWLLAALAVAGLAWLAWRRLRTRRSDEAWAGPRAPPRPPHEIALEALARLENSPLLGRGLVKEFHIEASDILRRYVDGRFGVGAPEMTTGEVLQRLEWSEADSAFRDGLASMLQTCDLVKFAKVRPGADRASELLALGRRLVEASIPWRPVPEPAGTAESVGTAPPAAV